MITIGIDPHKRTRTAVAIDEHHRMLGEFRLVASLWMTRSLVDWTGGLPGPRRWAVEGSEGLDRLLSS